MKVTEIEDIHMENIAIIGVDLAKRTFQLHGARSNGPVAFRKKLTQEKFLPFLAEQTACIVTMEACATAHGWSQEMLKLPQYMRRDLLAREFRHAGCRTLHEFDDSMPGIRKVSLWLGHASLRSTEIYLRADPTEKLETLMATTQPSLRRGRFKAPDKLVAMLRNAGRQCQLC